MKQKVAIIFTLFVFTAGLQTLTAAPTNTPPTLAATARPDDIDWARHVVQAYEEYTRQQQQTLRAIEQTRQDTAAAAAAAAETAKRSAAEVEARLREIEQSLSAQRQREMDNLQQSHRSTLIVVGAVAGIGLVCMLLLALLIMRSMNRRFEAVLAPRFGGGLAAAPAFGALDAGETQLVVADPATQSSARFVSAIDRLEKRLAAMEADLAEVPPAGTNGHSTTDSRDEESVMDEKAPQIASLLGKGQTLLNLEKTAEALHCFDEVLQLDPANAEALVKKGTVLERQGKVDEAIEYYDRAIASDNSMTMAYLCKGGVFNRLERYGEALECYEQALRTKETSHAAT